ncbi:response regulator transcription factor [Thalassotalea sp. PLHSN55]|uniref:response regulator transcription factor n=1 Tax=Thalassotalea sp. PLHSN55 TaxID=3435888 RepID=UPI003F86DC15
MCSSNQVLLIEDDLALAKSIVKFLTANGYIVRHFVNGDNLEHLVASNNFALILCDVMLPGTDGFEIIQLVRENFQGAYIFLTALSDTQHQLKGFELGADDYICKPVDPQLLLARVRACLKRKQPESTSRHHSDQIQFENLHICNDVRIATVDDKPIKLSRYEFDLLWLLALHKEKQLSREFLFVNTVGREYDGLDRTVDGRISRLRKKLESYVGLNCQICTSWGQGYMLSARA